MIILEYIWIDGNHEMRSKIKVMADNDFSGLNNTFPLWNYDGSSTSQTDTNNSEVVLSPVASYINPFPIWSKTTKAYLVLCDTYTYDEFGNLVPTCTNNRYNANLIFNKNVHMYPWYGIEQEYFMMANVINFDDKEIPAFCVDNGSGVGKGGMTYLRPQKNYYCGVGSANVKFRQLADEHLLYCGIAGLTVSGSNAEVAPNQWEFQIGPVEGINASDQLWVARYILCKLSEKYDIRISFKPKPLPHPWNGSGLHTNFSTVETRQPNGITAIHKYIQKLEQQHHKHIAVYGDNSQRLSGQCETSNAEYFNWGVGSRDTSVRIPKNVFMEGCGYLEDRRPASDADPYLVTSIIFHSCTMTDKF